MKKPYFQYTFIDITAYKTIEKKLYEQESFLQLILDNIPQLLFWKDRDLIEKYLQKDRNVLTEGKPEYHLEYKSEKDVWYDTKKIGSSELVV